MPNYRFGQVRLVEQMLSDTPLRSSRISRRLALWEIAYNNVQVYM
jgi:hypothetical protein